MKKTTLLLSLSLARRASLGPALGLLATLAFGSHPTRAAVTEAWVHRYSNVVSNSEDRAVKVVRDVAGHIIVTGTTDDGIHESDMLTIKYSGADGSVLWQQRYNGPGNSHDEARAVVVDGSGNVVVTGTSYGTNYFDYYTAKYAAADGALLWEQRYNGPADSSDSANALAVDGSGNVVVTGSSYNATNSDYYTAKYAAANGTLLWEKRYNGPANSYDSASAVAVDASGNVVVTGSSCNGTNYDYYTAKYAAADGALLWEQRYNGPGNLNVDQAYGVAVDGSGNVVVTGSSGQGFAYYPSNYDYYTVKYAAANGALLWEQRYDGPANSNDVANAVAVDGSGNVVVTGSSYNGTNYDYYTAKYAAASGALLWERRYNGPQGDYYYGMGQAMAVDGSGNVVVTGYSQGTNFNSDYYTAKYAAADGALLWEKRYDGPWHGGDRPSAVAVDDSGNVVVTGTSVGSGNYNDYYTAKYAATDGALVWEKRYNGPAKRQDFASALAVDGNGNVVVTGTAGYSYNFGGGDYYTAKYAAADGTLVWEKSYNGPADSYDSASAVAVDGSGNVVVTGSSYNGMDFYAADYYTAKYAATDGALLWEKRYNGPANSHDEARAVVMDGSGNVVVTGSSYNATNSDYYTAKYAAADGALLWEQRYNGPANSHDEARAVVVDGSGNVVVTGYSNNATNGYHDYYTAKYAAADGALLWEKRYNGPANGYDAAQAVAVDGMGNVVVTGSSSGTNSTPDYYTAKYAAADGALVWEKHHSGSYYYFELSSAVAVDGSGNVLVTGSSFSAFSGSNDDFYTAKYAAADGTLLWEKRYDGPLHGDDRPSAVAVDDSGNVVVTGVTDTADYETTGIADYYTAKYAAADGALLWEKRYNGPANGIDGASSLALGPNGMVAVTGSSSGDYATVVYRDDVYPISIALVPTGIRLRFIGIPGRSYTIERAPAVTGPWTTINTQTAPASGLVEYLDASSPPGQAFYRTVQP